MFFNVFADLDSKAIGHNYPQKAVIEYSHRVSWIKRK